jgi:hypothetical protein
LAREAEAARIAEEAEEKRLAAEAEEKRLAAEAEEKRKRKEGKKKAAEKAAKVTVKPKSAALGSGKRKEMDSDTEDDEAPRKRARREPVSRGSVGAEDANCSQCSKCAAAGTECVPVKSSSSRTWACEYCHSHRIKCSWTSAEPAGAAGITGTEVALRELADLTESGFAESEELLFDIRGALYDLISYQKLQLKLQFGDAADTGIKQVVAHRNKKRQERRDAQEIAEGSSKER